MVVKGILYGGQTNKNPSFEIYPVCFLDKFLKLFKPCFLSYKMRKPFIPLTNHLRIKSDNIINIINAVAGTK